MNSLNWKKKSKSHNPNRIKQCASPNILTRPNPNKVIQTKPKSLINAWSPHPKPQIATVQIKKLTSCLKNLEEEQVAARWWITGWRRRPWKARKGLSRVMDLGECGVMSLDSERKRPRGRRQWNILFYFFFFSIYILPISLF